MTAHFPSPCPRCRKPLGSEAVQVGDDFYHPKCFRDAGRVPLVDIPPAPAVTIVPESSELTPLQFEATLAGVRGHQHGEGPPIFKADLEVEASNGERVVRTYRWQVVQAGSGPRAVAEWLRPGGGWSLVRSPERCEQLLALTPAEHRGPA